MATREQLEKETRVFFDRHWSFATTPSWNFSWNWRSQIPDHDLPGVYALFSGDTLVYLGLGSYHGNDAHKKQGIGKRLLAHVLEIAPKDSKVRYILEERWQNAAVDMVATIEFPQECAYLASALEHYLSEALAQQRNHAKRINNKQQ
jgi:GNAT superfamily N-acetyltransferase